MSSRNPRAFLPVAVASGFCSAFGLTKALFALHSMYAATVVGPKLGPLPLIGLSAVDLTLGLTALVAGFAYVLRRKWAKYLLVYGSIPLALYEVGRALGLAAVGLTDAGAQNLAISTIMVLALVFVGLCARSHVSETYVASRTIAGH